jgi:hypothetical protein
MILISAAVLSRMPAMDTAALARIERTRKALWSPRFNRYVVVVDLPGQGLFAWCCAEKRPIVFSDWERAKEAAVTAPLEAFWSVAV